ncbi:MAG TPA: serine/threonine-protein kinase [Acidisarcina sp.]|nr:serine/threonine-protein kinase [Acidisarcina sp.]
MGEGMNNARHVPGSKTAVQTPAPVSANGSPDSGAPTTLGSASPTIAPVIGRELSPPGTLFEPGTALTQRYEILEILGEGGMGAVYKARDLELEREVALKVIRPELTSNPEILQRFKQELILARQITDRNVIRIFDLGDAGNIKFITMEFVEGESLHKILQQRGKLEVAEAVDIIEQVASGLAAVHREGVIHRDLKPGNIMRDKNGRVVVMDFGLARSFAGDGMTRTGTMLGTIEYMSPEQAQCQELTASSDIFTVGLILYQLLSGTMPFHAESAIASLVMRTQQRAIPLVNSDKKIPVLLSNIVSKCLETDPARRYQSAEGLVADIRAYKGQRGSKVSASTARLRMNRIRELPWKWIPMTAVPVILAVTGVVYYMNSRSQAAKGLTHTPVSVLVADFQNNTGDSLFDDTLEPMFNVALEGASFINGFNRGSARKVAAALPNPAHTLDEQTSRLVAVKEGIAAIVTGSLSKHGGGYDLSVKAIDAVTGKTLSDASVTTSNKDALLLEIPKLAVPIRQALGDTTPKSVQLTAAQGTFSTDSLEAVHQYSVGMEQQFQGKWTDALQSFSKATQLDPNFARAYAGMAAASGNLGQLQDAEKYAKLAMEHVDRMTERERYRVRGLYYIWTQNWQKCTEEYGDLIREFPADNIGHSNLAACYARQLDMPKAMEAARVGLKIMPNNVMARMNSSLYSCYANDFPSCGRGGREVLQLNPTYEEAFLVIAHADMGEGQLSLAAARYQSLEKISPRGASLAASGLANLALYEGRYQEGIQILEKGIAADLAANNPAAAADKVLMLAYANLWRGDKQEAAAAARRAIALRQSAKVRFLAARVLAEVEETVGARQLASGLGSEIHAEPQAYAKLILGEVALKAHNPGQAIQLFTSAKALLDTWIGHFDLGRAYLEAGAFEEADSEFDRCIKRRGEVLELFMDDMPTYSFLPAVYYYQGRDREGLKSNGFADSYRTYLSMRGQSTNDPLVAEIHRRLHQ